jgi:two-component system, chemotaxis family, chemotaxis protein CheY
MRCVIHTDEEYMKILIVDDSAAIRLKLRNFLTSLGHTVVAEAANGEDAISAFKKTNPDLVTMDLVMPKMGGLEAMMQILEVDPKANVAVVTSAGTAQIRKEVQKVGACYFLQKPFTKDEVKTMVSETEKRLGKAA